MSPVPSRLSKQQLLTILKVAVYVGLSSAIAYLISWATNNKDMLGVTWAPINIVLVALKQVFTKPE